MRALTMRRRYERALPVVLAIVVASAITAGLALLVLPADDGDSGDDGVESALVPDGDGGDATPSGDQAESPVDSSSATAEPEGSTAPTVPPTPTAREIRRPSPTPTVTPTSGPVLAERNLVANGGFSDGLDGWYQEGDVGIAAGSGRNGTAAVRVGAAGGYIDERVTVEAGRTYRLQAWANVTSGGDEVEVGVLYSDAAGNRLESEEPSPIAYDETTLTRRSIRFTPPEDAVIVRVYVWKESGSAEFIVDDISVREFISTG